MSSIKRSIATPLRMVILMWIVFLFEVSSGMSLNIFGIVPRQPIGLAGILVSPFLHGSMLHLMSNTIPLLILGTMVYMFYNKVAPKVFIICYLLTGVLVWVVARPFSHIGASGFVYGIAFFLFSIGFFRRDAMSIFISISTLILYGGIVYGILPTDPNISYESHFMGALCGIFCAVKFGREKKTVY